MADASTGTPEETARLAVLSRLGLGAAHALNNAFTSALGEIGFLQEHGKGDPALEEACALLAGEIERCARITRGLLGRRHPSQAGSREVDLVRLVRELAPLLGETLGSAHRLEVDAPDDLRLVACEAERLELLVLCLVLVAVDQAGERSRLQLAIGGDPGPGSATLRLQVTAAGSPERVVEAWLDPRRAPDATTRACLETVARVVSHCGGSRWAAATAPDSWTALIRLPVLEA